MSPPYGCREMNTSPRIFYRNLYLEAKSSFMYILHCSEAMLSLDFTIELGDTDYTLNSECLYRPLTSSQS